MNSSNSDIIKILVGGYNLLSEAGLNLLQIDLTTGAFKILDDCNIDNASYGNINPRKSDILYCVSEKDLTDSEAVALHIDPADNKIKILSRVPLSGSPCYIASNGKIVATANYGGGTLSLMPVATDASMSAETHVIPGKATGPHPIRQKDPHIHCTVFSKDGKRVYATDFSSDRILFIDIDTIGEQNIVTSATTAGSLQLPAGTGPRHIIFNSQFTFAYIIGELSGNISVCKVLPDNTLQVVQTIEADTRHNSGSAHIALSPDEKYLYASNRLGSDGIVVFKVDTDSGKLFKIAEMPTGPHPRHFTITPDGNYLLVACRDSNTIEIYKRVIESGQLTPTEIGIPTHSPVFLHCLSEAVPTDAETAF